MSIGYAIAGGFFGRLNEMVQEEKELELAKAVEQAKEKLIADGFNVANKLAGESEDVQKATKQANQTSIDRPVEGVQSLTETVTDMKQGQQQSDANAKLVESTNDAIGSLIDTKA